MKSLNLFLLLLLISSTTYADSKESRKKEEEIRRQRREAMKDGKVTPEEQRKIKETENKATKKK